MATSTQGNFSDLRIEVEQVEVTSNLPQPDKNWRYTDQQGHEHYYSVEGHVHSSRYPTLREVVDRSYWCGDCEDEHEDTHLECKVCGETIVPGMVEPSGFREFAPGRRQAYLNGVPISGERAEEIMGQMKAAREAAQREEETKRLRALSTDDLRAELERREREGRA